MKILTLFSLIITISFFSCDTSKEENANDHDHHSRHGQGSNHDHHSNKMHKRSHQKSNVHMNKTDFETLAKRFDDPERDKWQQPEKVIALFGDLRKKKIADIGSGTGYFSIKLANKGAKVIAIDVDKRFTQLIDEKIENNDQSKIVTRLVGYDDPELKKDEVDGILTVNTYHHFNDKIEYMNKCHSGLKKGGKLMIVDFKKKDTPHGPPSDHRIAGTEIMSDLKIVGFSSITIDKKTLPEQNIIIAIK